ncbi:hypothetical protein T03_17744 [Trichinella britovi]|uniref:Uncharacterized protein n=1 Tax=Trichinella britovi TaxID=45882 RepID=A0A0V1CBD8_TRIBR|nr:hypothetical protein T03_17744 [Trichinella britovi]
MEFFKLAFFDYYPIFCDSQLIAVHVVGKPYRYISNEKYALEKDHCLNLLPHNYIAKIMNEMKVLPAAFKENHAITSVYLMQMVDCFGRLKEIYVSYVCSKN